MPFTPTSPALLIATTHIQRTSYKVKYCLICCLLLGLNHSSHLQKDSFCRIQTQGRNLQLWQSALQSPFAVNAKWQCPFQGTCHTTAGTHIWGGEWTPCCLGRGLRAPLWPQLHMDKLQLKGAWQQESWVWSPGQRSLTAVFQLLLCHLQLDWGPQSTPSPWEGWWQQQPVCREWEREIQQQGCSCFILLLAADYEC